MPKSRSSRALLGLALLALTAPQSVMADPAPAALAALRALPGDVVALDSASAFKAAGLKVPHMGWNELAIAATSHPVLAGIGQGAHAYFVHSYKMACAEPSDILASVDYGGPIAAVVGRDNLIGTQFHPEKSQETGLRLIANFLRWNI